MCVTSKCSGIIGSEAVAGAPGVIAKRIVGERKAAVLKNFLMNPGAKLEDVLLLIVVKFQPPEMTGIATEEAALPSSVTKLVAEVAGVVEGEVVAEL